MKLRWKREEGPGQGGPGARYRVRAGDLTLAMVAQHAGRWYAFSMLGPRFPWNTLTEEPPRTWESADEARGVAAAWARGALERLGAMTDVGAARGRT